MRILAFIFIFFSSVRILFSGRVVTAQSHLRLHEMMPSLSADKDDGNEDVSDNDESLSYGGRHLGHAQPDKVDICHIPPGNPQNFNTKTVSSRSVPAHLAKGSLLGACNEWCSQLCDDGNVCTIDAPAGYDCEVNRCPPLEGRDIDCDDNNECTGATCSPATGCIYHSVNCDDSAYACAENICDLTANEECHGACEYDVNAYECPSPGEACDVTTGCFPSKVCSNVPGEVCEPTNGGCVGPTNCTFSTYGACNDANNCPTNKKSLAECEAACYSVNENIPPLSAPFYIPWCFGLLYTSYSGLYSGWDGVSEYNEEGSCFLLMNIPVFPPYNTCSFLLGDLYEPGLDSGRLEEYDPDTTVNCYDCV